MSFDGDAIIKGIISGHIKPALVETKIDKWGHPLTIFDFPQFECQIHAHFTDEDREVIAPSRIVPYSRDENESYPIDNFVLAMLRHYAEESGALPSSPIKDAITPKKPTKRFPIFMVIGSIIVIGIIILLRNSGSGPSDNNHSKPIYYITVKESINIDGFTFEPGIKYPTSTSKPVQWQSNRGAGGYGYDLGFLKRPDGSRRNIFMPADKVEQVYSE